MSQDELEPLSVPPESCPFAQQLCMPQFGIIHLLILTAVVAVLLKINLAMEFDVAGDASSMQSWLSWSRQFFQTIYAVLFATELVGAGLLVRARCFAMLGRLQPGHWIILISALIGILGGWHGPCTNSSRLISASPFGSLLSLLDPSVF
jgi:mannose/fructose/N-acetylgalactosamine-specific phosphotransferase system component IID